MGRPTIGQAAINRYALPCWRIRIYTYRPVTMTGDFGAELGLRRGNMVRSQRPAPVNIPPGLLYGIGLVRGGTSAPTDISTGAGVDGVQVGRFVGI